ncbi:hypothetical protein Tsubulata_001724 [Turnera subulata]|uniref:Uncharacterized protein n=1 Tax=Turnera subulata TaxID=218843 RepID=A0A9Q0G198_9ROSI|nr:hypothetical protein Tsubulata_001724 [Turnera subulata]
MKNHDSRPTGSVPFPKAIAAVYDTFDRDQGRGRGRGCGHGRDQYSNRDVNVYKNSKTLNRRANKEKRMNQTYERNNHEKKKS